MRQLTVALLLAAACSHVNYKDRLRSDSVGEPSADGVPRDGFFRELDLACGVSATPGADRFTRQPYLQKVTARSAEILWAGRGPARVIVTTADGADVARVDGTIDPTSRPTRGVQYVARVGDLQPDTVYCYRMVDDDGPLLGATGFRTAPAPGRGQARFVAIGDLGKGTLGQLVLRAQLFDFATDFVVVPGDVAYDSGTTGQLERHVFAIYRRHMRHVPFYVAAGNHDYETQSAEPLRQAFALPDSGGPDAGERWYSLDWGPVHVTVLDSQAVSPTQLAWLERDLAASAGAPWRVVVLHHPLYSSGHHGGHRPTIEAFRDLFERHRVDLVLSGHDHHYERVRPQGGVTYLVTGGGGRGARDTGTSPFTAFASSVIHLTYVVADRRQLRIYAVDATGQEIDSAVLER